MKQREEWEELVCSSDLAKKLKELGVPQRSVFWWLDRPGSGLEVVIAWLGYGANHGFQRCFAAFTSAELGEMLPESLNGQGWLSIRQGGEDGGWGASYGHLSRRGDGSVWEPTKTMEADTEADARAKMLIYLLENGLLTL